MTDNWLEDFLQEKVNEVALKLIKECPDIAKNEPKRIGEMSRMIVLDAFAQTVDEFGATEN